MMQPLHLKNAHIWDGTSAVQRDLYTSDVVLDAPAPNAVVVDLAGYTIFPGMINAHDHLELNHYPRSKFREVYDNAHQWGEDMDARLDTEPYKSLQAYPLWDRLFIGGLKNLLCGATTVAHHGPPYKEMYCKEFPVRVLKKYGWAHSLHFSTEAEIVASYQNTPKDWPWFIHLAEGTDEVAASEYQRLKALGCVGENTVIVHGVGLTEGDIEDAAPRVRGLVWCPTTNLYLLGKSINVQRWIEAGGNLAVGNDSRLTASADFLVEAFEATCITASNEAFPVECSLRSGKTVLGIQEAGHLQPGAKADWYTYPDGELHRLDVGVVVKGGVPQIGDPGVMAKFPHVETVCATLDGVPKAIHRDLARRILKCKLREPGLVIEEAPKRRFWFLS